MSRNFTVPVHAIWLAQDDPKKNTAVKLSKRNDIHLHRKMKRLPRRGIILEPLCGKVLGPEDHSLLLQEGGSLVGLDCSWNSLFIRSTSSRCFSDIDSGLFNVYSTGVSSGENK